jgi:hypothetical protein
MMIDDVDRQLKDWAMTVVGDVEVSLHPPGKPIQGRTVGLYLMDLSRVQTPRGQDPPPHQVLLRYLVTTSSENCEEAHHMLDELMFAALANTSFEVESEPIPVSLWSALDVVPRPAFIVRVPLRRERPKRIVPMVRQPVVVETSAIMSLQGVVVGPGDVPLMGARVEMPELHVSATTDHNGRFRFGGVPVAPTKKKLRVRAKGRELTIEADTEGERSQNLMIQVPSMEN